MAADRREEARDVPPTGSVSASNNQLEPQLHLRQQGAKGNGRALVEPGRRVATLEQPHRLRALADLIGAFRFEDLEQAGPPAGDRGPPGICRKPKRSPGALSQVSPGPDGQGRSLPTEMRSGGTGPRGLRLALTAYDITNRAVSLRQSVRLEPTCCQSNPEDGETEPWRYLD